MTCGTTDSALLHPPFSLFFSSFLSQAWHSDGPQYETMSDSLLSLVLPYVAEHLPLGAYFRARRAVCLTNEDDDRATSTLLARERMKLKSRLPTLSLSLKMVLTKRCHECGKGCSSKCKICTRCLTAEGGFRECVSRVDIGMAVRRKGHKASFAKRVYEQLVPVFAILPTGAYLYSKRRFLAVLSAHPNPLLH